MWRSADFWGPNLLDQFLKKFFKDKLRSRNLKYIPDENQTMFRKYVDKTIWLNFKLNVVLDETFVIKPKPFDRNLPTLAKVQ